MKDFTTQKQERIKQFFEMISKTGELNICLAYQLIVDPSGEHIRTLLVFCRFQKKNIFQFTFHPNIFFLQKQNTVKK